MFKRKNPRAVGSNRRILDRNVVVHLVQVVFYLSIVVKLALFDSCSAWESPRNQICFIPSLLGTLLLFLLYSLVFQCFKANVKARLGEVN